MRKTCLSGMGLRVVLGITLVGTAALGDPPASGPASGPASAPANHTSLNLHALTPPKDPFVSDEEVEQAIEKGQTWLMGQFENGKIKDFVATDRYHGTGVDALGVYALYQCGLSSHKDQLDPKDPFMKNLLDTLKALPIDDAVSTYTRGLRVTALAAVNRQEDRGIIGEDSMHLMDGCHAGAFTYALMPQEYDSHLKKGYLKPSTTWDNSNSQYGLLGIWSAAEIGAEIPDDLWQVVEKHWTDNQMADGEWTYGGPTDGHHPVTMSLAGIASTFVCHEYLDVAKPANVGREPFTPSLAKGLAWLEDGEHARLDYTYGYGRYGLERVGLASGFKYFGTHDWYREQATKIVREQGADGTWDLGPPGPRAYFTNPIIEESYHLLFLARGRHPVLMNKLRYEHFWCNRPRDLANLAKYAYKELETTFNWEVVPSTHDWPDWTDSPVLYIASHQAPKFTDADYAKIRMFALAGGLIFTQADGGSPAFTKYIESEFVPKVFHDYELAKVPDSHWILNVYEPIKGKVPPLEMISNGARTLMVHSPTDLTMYWQQRASKTHGESFQLGLNLFVYAGGKSDFGHRGTSSYIADPPDKELSATLKVARIKYPLPSWDPEPYAWKHFSNWLAWQTSVAVDPQPVDMEKLGDVDVNAVPLAHLTGTNGYTATEAQIKSIRKYVESGGTLLMDPCGGSTFSESINKIIAQAFPGSKLERVPASHAVFTFDSAPAVDMSKPKLRPYARNVLGNKPPPPMMLTAGKGQVIYVQVDLTNSLLGSRTWGILGYETPWAMQFLKNLVLSTATAK